MIKDILIIFLLFVILYVLYTNLYENMGDDNNFKYLNNGSSYLVYNNIYLPDEYIELTTLPKYNKQIKADYGINTNTINNNNISIYQDIIEPLFNTIEINDKNFNLMSIAWKRSPFTYNNKRVGLDLHLIHRNYISIYNLVIVIPLDLVYDGISAYNNNDDDIDEELNNNSTNDLVPYQLPDYTSKINNEHNLEPEPEPDYSLEPEPEPDYSLAPDPVNIISELNNNVITEINNNDNDIEETFKNIGYIKMKQLSNQIEINPLFEEKYPDTLSATPTIKPDIDLQNFNQRKEKQKNKYNLDSNNSNIIIDNLLTNKLFIPDYKCCVDTIGTIQKFNLYNLKNIILKNKTFYQLEDQNNNIYYICEPIRFPEDIGLDIREKLVDDLNIKYLKNI